MRLACLVMCTAAPTVLADELVILATRYQQITINGFDGTRIEYTTPGGDFLYAELANIEYVQVDSVTNLRDLNKAESYAREGDHRRAISLYDRALRVANEFWPPLIRARMILAAHRAADVDVVATQMIALTRDGEHGAARAAAVLPQGEWTIEPGKAKRALRPLNAAIDNAATDRNRIVLEALRLLLATSADIDDAATFADAFTRQPIPASVSSRAVHHAKAKALQTLAASGNRTIAIQRLDAAFDTVDRELLPEFLIARARITLAAATSSNDNLRAASSAMRLVAHFPGDPLVAEALAITAQAHERIDRPQCAARLWSECRRHKTASNALADRADRAIQRIQSES